MKHHSDYDWSGKWLYDVIERKNELYDMVYGTRFIKKEELEPLEEELEVITSYIDDEEYYYDD